MTLRTLDGDMFTQMVLSGASHLRNNADKIDALNVFPVPDGDTGTNMNLSMTSGADETKKVTENDISAVSEALAKGLLMGARGNSGVILSQIFRGFSKGLDKQKSISTKQFAQALNAGVETAYKAVMKPVEGTILTVAKDAANEAVQAAETEEDMIKVMERTVSAANTSLEQTPDLLPVLKEVGVVDSGGQGLVTIYEGFAAALKGEAPPDTSSEVTMDEMVNAEHHKQAQDFMKTEDIEFGYCTEFMVQFESDKLKAHPFDETAFRESLSEHGDSLLVVSDDDVVKIHIHTEYPGNVMTLGQTYGSLINIKIDNMREQHTGIVGEQSDASDQQKDEYGIVTVGMGTGIRSLFESLGTSVVIEGGQTMNPSTQDIADAIEEANAHHVLVLPNNKNITMAAEQAGDLSEDEVAVVPTISIPQGIGAMLAFHPDATLDDNKAAMTEASQLVKTGQVTYAVRDTQIEGMAIEKDHFMGLADGEIKATDKSKLETAKTLITAMIGPDDEILTIFQGEDTTDDETEEVVSYVEHHFPEIEIESHKGNQPIYAYIFSVE